MWQAARSGRAWTVRVAAVVAALLGAAAGAAYGQDGSVLRRGDRVRVWTASLVTSAAAAGEPTTGKLWGIGPDTLEVVTAGTQYSIPRSVVTRIERSIGRPHAWRNAAYGFFGTLLVGTVINAAASSRCSGFLGSDWCFAAGTLLIVLPASGLAALIGGTSAREHFEPAVLPPPPAASVPGTGRHPASAN